MKQNFLALAGSQCSGCGVFFWCGGLAFESERERERMDPKKDKLIRRTTIGVTVVAAYLLLTADYGPNPNVLDPIKKAIQSAELSVKRVLFNSGKEETVENGKEKQSSLDSKDHP